VKLSPGRWNSNGKVANAGRIVHTRKTSRNPSRGWSSRLRCIVVTRISTPATKVITIDWW
jgi:hypothetical protein